MPRIIPIKDLKKTNELVELCEESKEPVFVTKNGYGSMVIMSLETYERTMLQNDLYHKLQQGEDSITKGKVKDAFDSLEEIRGKYAL